MPHIHHKFKDNTERTGNVSILLDANQVLNHFQITYPITWKGFINNYPIEIIQITESFKFVEDYDFKTYPDNYAMYQSQIVSLIDNLLKKMLD